MGVLRQVPSNYLRSLVFARFLPCFLIAVVLSHATSRSLFFQYNSGVSGGMDSFFEYLLKAGIALGKPEYIKMFSTGYAAINKHVKKDVWYAFASLPLLSLL